MVLENYKKKKQEKKLIVVLEDYRKKELINQRNHERINQRKKEYRQRNGELVRGQEVTYRQRNRDRIRAQQKEYRQRNPERIQARKQQPYREMRDVRNKEQMMDMRAKRQRVCVCGLCFFCNGFSATSWASIFDSYSDVLEEEEEDPKDSSDSDTSSVVDPQLVEQLERTLNEPSKCSDLSYSEDELEDRLT